MTDVRNLAIIGSGPAGLTAALYASRANLQPLLIAGYQVGGQLMLTTDVENYPGFPEGIQGPELMELMKKQAARFGTDIVEKDVDRVDLKARPFKLWVEDTEYQAKSVIVATGASAKWLGLPSEKKLQGKGVSACATCDGFFFKGKDVAVVGGGDTAMEEATFLTRFASKVVVVHRREEFKASAIMLERARKNPKISWQLNTEVLEVLGKDKVEGLRLATHSQGNPAERLARGEQVKQWDLPVGGFFLAIGHEPNTKFLQGQIDLDAKGYIRVRDHTKTSVEGVFAAGDVHDPRYRQAVTAAGAGCMAALDAEKWLEAQEP
ncbi:MAG TPA: thioredoxin-disulfide reductase [Candidatus Thermoplasmatota archaeon]|nr:thioredoxin-disulfide reductase [Candidatus Thermoplasmatota archaeon]